MISHHAMIHRGRGREVELSTGGDEDEPPRPLSPLTTQPPSPSPPRNCELLPNSNLQCLSAQTHLGGRCSNCESTATTFRPARVAEAGRWPCSIFQRGAEAPTWAHNPAAVVPFAELTDEPSLVRRLSPLRVSACRGAKLRGGGP